MSEQTITCPKCGSRFPLSKAFTNQIEMELRKSFEAKEEQFKRDSQEDLERRLRDEAIRVERQVRKEAEREASAEVNKLRRDLLEFQKREKTSEADFERRLSEEKRRLEKQTKRSIEDEMTGLKKKLREQEREALDLQRQKDRLDARSKSLDLEIERKVDAASRAASAEVIKLRRDLSEVQKREKTTEVDFERRLSEEKRRLEKQTRKYVEEEMSGELSGLKKKLREQERETADMQRQKDKLDARAKSLEFEITRKVEAASRRSREEARDELESEYRSQRLEWEKKVRDATQQAAELKRKLEQGSQQVQGEVIELELERVLRRKFPDDEIEAISTGKLGADILQKIYTTSREYCGAILWESKNTQNWSKAWLGKLRSDKRRAKAELAVLVSAVMPKDIRHFGPVDGIWVTEFSVAPSVASILRNSLMQIAMLKLSSGGKNEKIEMLYAYLSSIEFRHRIEAVAESFRSMKEDLDKERTSMERQWAKREKQMQMALQNFSGMYGDMQAIVGQSLPKIRRLELPAAGEY
jgi:hypothetical protein